MNLSFIVCVGCTATHFTSDWSSQFQPHGKRTCELWSNKHNMIY